MKTDGLKSAALAAAKVQGGHTAAFLISEVVEKAFSIKNKGIVNLIVGITLPLLCNKVLAKWKIDDEFVVGLSLSAFDGATTILQNMVGTEKKEVGVNEFLKDAIHLNGDKAKTLGYAEEIFTLPNGLQVMELPNGTFMDQQGNVYNYQQLQQMSARGAMAPVQQIMPVAGFGEDEEDLDDDDLDLDVDEYDLMMDELSRDVDLQGDDEEERLESRSSVVLNGTTRDIRLY